MLPDNSGTTINGVTLTSMNLMLVGSIKAGGPNAATSYVTVPGMDGALDLTLYNPDSAAYFGRRNVSVPIATVGTKTEVLIAKTELGRYAGKSVDLYDARNLGYWRGILSVGEWYDVQESEDGLYASTATVTIDAEPAMVLPVQTVDIASATSSAVILGNRPTWPTFVLSPSGSSSTIGVAVKRMDNTVVGSVSFTDSQTIASTSRVTVDCYMGTMVMNDNTVLAVSINYDFPQLLPEEVRIVLTGCSSAVMTYEPRLMV